VNLEKTLSRERGRVEDFLMQTADSRYLAEKCRDYKDHKQWTDAERAKLNSRNQAPIQVNRIKPKVEAMKGLIISRKTDPRAISRTPKHNAAAEAVTDSLRYVADNNDFDNIKLDVADNMIIEGYGAAIIEMQAKGKENEVKVIHIPWDRYYYDFYSRKLDFTDKRWDGIVLWMDSEEVMELFDLGEEKVEAMLNEGSFDDFDDTYEDRPHWADYKQSRIRICQHFFIHKGVWHISYFSNNEWLIEPTPSPYLDEFGAPMNPIEAQAANIDRENNRFGEVVYWLDLQDEINHRRSKFLHLLNNRQTTGRVGAIQDIAQMKRELSKPDGHVEYNGEKGDFDIIPNGDMKNGQFELYQDGKAELDAVSINAQLSGERQGDLSGLAIGRLQQAGLNELSSFYNGLASWEVRVYRQKWARIRQFWDDEKWIRVTDDNNVLRFVGLNQKVTVQQLLEEKIQDESLDIQQRQQAQQTLQALAEAQDPRLGQIVEVKNPIAELDMDITIDISLDSANIQSEQFDSLMKIAQTRPDIPFSEMIKLYPGLREKTKKRVIDSLESSAKAAQEQNQRAAQIQESEIQAKNADKLASADKKKVEAEQTLVQTDLMLTQGVEDPAVVI